VLAVAVPPPPAPPPARSQPGELTGRLRLLQAAWATSAYDRFVTAPLLVSISAGLGVSLAAAAAAASWYFLLYGLSQPAWGLCSDRFGRVRTMRVTLALAGVAGLVSSLAPDLTLLLLTRAVTGATMAAVVPTSLVYVGDVVPFARRHRVLTDINAATATGITLATASAGVIAGAVSWRLAFAVPATAALGLAVVLRRLPEPPPTEGAQRGIATVVRRPWALAVLGLCVVEGAALLGFLTYLAPALESTGSPPSVAGLVVALYGVGLFLASRVVKRVADRSPPSLLIAAGAACLAVGYLTVVLDRGPVAVGTAAVLVGVGWASMHSTMQAWATEVVPEARAVMVSLFAAALFAGSGVATAALAGLAGAGEWELLFGSGVAVVLGFAAVAPAARLRFGRRQVAAP